MYSIFRHLLEFMEPIPHGYCGPTEYFLFHKQFFYGGRNLHWDCDSAKHQMQISVWCVPVSLHSLGEFATLHNHASKGDCCYIKA